MFVGFQWLSPFAWNFRHQGPMVNKRPEEFNEEQRAFLRPFGVYNLTEIPLVHEGRFIGKISIANKPGGLSENDVRLVTVFAAQTAVVIQNARLYRRLQESAAQLEVKVRERTSELEATYRELESSHARLREVDQLKSDFLGNVSHELRTPLAAVKGYVDNLLDGVAGPLTGKPRHYLGRVRENIDRLSRMVSDQGSTAYAPPPGRKGGWSFRRSVSRSRQRGASILLCASNRSAATATRPGSVTSRSSSRRPTIRSAPKRRRGSTR
jgi:signal transduction histidine kinase